MTIKHSCTLQSLSLQYTQCTYTQWAYTLTHEHHCEVHAGELLYSRRMGWGKPVGENNHKEHLTTKSIVTVYAVQSASFASSYVGL